MEQKNRISLKGFLVFLFPAAFLIGCGERECTQKVQDVAYIHNHTRANFYFQVCKGGFGESRVHVQPTTSGFVNLGTRDQTVSKSDAFGVCKTKDLRDETIVLSLAPSSVGTVLLCYRQIDNSYALMPVSPAGCPAGYIEHSSPEACPHF